MFADRSSRRAAAATAIWGCTALMVAVFAVRNSVQALLFLFYGLLLWNTLLSIRFFEKLLPRQPIIDGALFALYILLALAIPFARGFATIAVILFFVATLKYAVLLPSGALTSLLRRKTLIDSMGMILAVVAWTGIFLGHELPAVAGWTVIFAAANYYFIFKNPLYSIAPARKP